MTHLDEMGTLFFLDIIDPMYFDEMGTLHKEEIGTMYFDEIGTWALCQLSAKSPGVHLTAAGVRHLLLLSY